MPLRTRIFVIISVVVLIILTLSIILVIVTRKAKDDLGSNSTTTAQTNQSSITDLGAQIQFVDPSGRVVTPDQFTVKPLTNTEIQKVGAKQAARIFVERYGSYSTDNKQQNIKAIKSLVTVSLWSELSKKIGSTSQGDFVGVTTKVVSTRITNWAGSSAIVKINSVREVTSNNTTKNNQAAVTVYLVKSQDSWLVNKFVWDH